MRLPTWEQLDHRQRGVRDFPPDHSLFVVGPPGSGKTVLTAQRASLLADSGQSVVIITFNRMLRRLLHLRGGTGRDIEIRTMHSFVLSDFRSREGEHEIGDEYDFDWPLMIDTVRKAPDSAAPKHLVIDEGQDLPEGFYRYVSCDETRRLSVFADQDQAIRRESTSIEQIRNASGLASPLILPHNYRTTRRIARFAEHFHGGDLPAASVARTELGDTPRLVRSADLSDTAVRIQRWVRNRGGSVGVIVDTNGAGRKVHDELSKIDPELRVDAYHHDLKNEDEIDVTRDGVTILTKQSVKGQEFDCVFLLQLERFVPCSTDVERRAMYMMCARAREFLFLVYGPGELTSAMTAALPGPEVLQRGGFPG